MNDNNVATNTVNNTDLNQNIPSNNVEYTLNGVVNKSEEQNAYNDFELYLQHYIGEKYYSYLNGGISFAYFFWGDLFLIYRKMYLLTFMKYCLLVILSIILNSFMFALLIYKAFDFGLMFYIKRIYYKHSVKKVYRILEENKGFTQIELLDICSRRGGVSVWAPIIYCILLYFLPIIFFSILLSGLRHLYLTNIIL